MIIQNVTVEKKKKKKTSPCPVMYIKPCAD